MEIRNVNNIAKTSIVELEKMKEKEGIYNLPNRKGENFKKLLF